MVTYRNDPITTAIIATLTSAGFTVGDGDKPANAGWSGTAGLSDFRRYVVVYPIGGGETDGPINAPFDDVWPIFQTSCYGAVRAQADRCADDVRAVLLATELVTADRRSAQVRWESTSGALRFDEPQPTIWQVADRYQFVTTPVT